MADDTSTSVIGAPQVEQSVGADGHGMKIAIVDDGIDQTNPFFDPAGYSYPAGFPRGNTKYTTPKVIVARSFPGPGSGKAGKLPLDPATSFHGTHVAGIAAGEEGTTAPAGLDHPRVTGLRGVAPRAWLGNYRVFTVPSPYGDEADTPEIIAAFESAVRDGMDVINFSGGGPQTDPANDALDHGRPERRRRRRRARDRRRQRPRPIRRRLGRLARDRVRGNRRRRHLEHARVRTGAERHHAPARPPTCTGSPSRPPTARPPLRSGAPLRTRSSTSGRSPAPTGSPSTGTSVARPTTSPPRRERCRRAPSPARSRSSPAASAPSRRRPRRRRPPARSESSSPTTTRGRRT